MMLIYDQEFSVSTFTLLDRLFSDYVRQEILEIVEANPTSRFYCQIDDKDPNLYIYLIERNQAEAYTLCHFFSTDRIGDDYLYQNIPLEHIHALEQFASHLSLV